MPKPTETAESIIIDKVKRRGHRPISRKQNSSATLERVSSQGRIRRVSCTGQPLTYDFRVITKKGRFCSAKRSQRGISRFPDRFWALPDKSLFLFALSV